MRNDVRVVRARTHHVLVEAGKEPHLVARLGRSKLVEVVGQHQDPVPVHVDLGQPVADG